MVPMAERTPLRMCCLRRSWRGNLDPSVQASEVPKRGEEPAAAVVVLTAPRPGRVIRDRNHALEVDLMSLVRVHNFSVSLDGFGTGVAQSMEAPFGHAKERLLEWFFGTRTFHAM